MAQHDVVVIGASSGGVEALLKVLSGLPAELAAAVFVVLHVRPDAPSYLPAILNRAGNLPAAHAVDGESIRQGRIYVAPPGHQTYVQKGRIGVRRGPSENLHRPAIDPLFRTAAHHYGPRCIGIVLSGALDDGSAGLLAIERGGGVTIVQDPTDAAVPNMPTNALAKVSADYCVRADAMGELLTRLVPTEARTGELPVEVPLETIVEAESRGDAHASAELGNPTPFTCPDCSGTLYEIHDGGAVRYRCRVGHAYSEDTLVQAQSDSVERALWTAVRALEERMALVEKLAGDARSRRHEGVAIMFEQRRQDIDRDIRAIHDLITTGQSLEPVGQEPI